MSESVGKVRQQFGRTAENYARESGFREDIEPIVQAARPRATDRALDAGTGAGHVALALAPHVQSVTGLDATPEMIEQARELAAQARLGNLDWVEGDVHDLPFEDASFEIVTCRVCAHHFADPGRFVREVRRVLAPGGRFVLADNYAPDEPGADRWLNTLEKTRDPSHVREWRLSEWEEFFSGGGLKWELVRIWEMPVQVAAWLEKASVPEASRTAIWKMLQSPPPGGTKLLKVQPQAPEFNILRMLAVGMETKE